MWSGKGKGRRKKRRKKKEEDEEEDEEEDDDEEEDEEMTVRKGAKRKRGHECGVCEKGVCKTITFGHTHAYAHERETVRDAMCARSVLLKLVI